MVHRYTASYQGKWPPVIRLEPLPGTQMFGRPGGFLIHGDNATHTASQGCIIVDGAALRAQIWDHGDRDLEVVE
jgi:hypothetical protein